MNDSTRSLPVLWACGLGLAWSAIAWGQESPRQAWPPLPEQVTAEIDIYPQETIHEVSPQLVGTNLTQSAVDRAQAVNPATLARVKEMGIKTVRFPNGCLADRYNWRNPAPGQMTVDEFLDFCEAIEAEPYYTLNMQGGTEGLEGMPPPGAPLEERIRYRHTAPNPCGNTDYHFGTLAEAVELMRKYTIERAVAGKRPLTHFELGNENWGQARTDWPPEIYGATCEAYVRAMFQALIDAQQTEGKATDVLPYFVMVGYPSMGNNQDPTQAPDRAVNLAWTAEVNRLAEAGLIDAVQEHFYTYGGNTGDTLIWTVHNLTNILSLRHGIPNPRLGGYVDPELKYHVPLEWTEWNMKCWGKRPNDNRPLPNAGFEEGTKGWTVEIKPEGTGSATVRPEAARRGSAGLELVTGPEGRAAEVRQEISLKGRLPLAMIGAGLWVKTDSPTALHAILRQANDGPSKGQIIGLTTATQAGTWQRIVLTGAPKPDTTTCDLVIRLKGKNLRAWVDEVQPIEWKTTAGAMPLAADRFEQQLHNVDALRVLLEWPTPRTHYHHLFGNYPCGTLKGDGSERPNAAAFKLLAGRIGTQLVRTDVQTASFGHVGPKNGATDFNGATPSVDAVPVLSATTTRHGNEVYTILMNRSSDRPVRTRINLRGCTVRPEADVRTLVGQDIDLADARIETASLPASNPLMLTVPPYSAQVLRLGIDQMVTIPLVASTEKIERSSRVGLQPEMDTFALSTSGGQPVSFVIVSDADWLTVSPASGRLAGEQLQVINVSYSAGHLRPGVHRAQLSILSMDAYNSPLKIPMELVIRPVRPDYDRDGDVDEADMQRFMVCMMAMPMLQASRACDHARLDADDDVDINDYFIFESCLSGKDRFPGKECGG